MAVGINDRLGLGLRETLDAHRPEGLKKPVAKKAKS